MDRICIADTVGIATPALMKEKVDCILNTTNLPVAVHCHNDFGLAVIIAEILKGIINQCRALK